ncbi:MAG: hypothetical protein K6B28_01180 [Lachnospiraceae bacterium]|nr:hypothetical protein [Lachnospiraceae bacterium]
MEKKIRYYKYVLYYSGLAVIAFGVWDIVQTFIITYYDDELINFIIEDVGNEALTISDIKVIIVVVIALMGLIEIAGRAYIGLNAVKAAKGEKRSDAYIVFAILYSSIVIISYFIEILDNFKESRYDIIFYTVRIIICLTSVFGLIEIIISALKIKRLQKEISVLENPG